MLQHAGVGRPFGHPGVDAILLMTQGMMASLNWPREEWKANMAAVDLGMFLMDVKLKIKHTSLKRRPISKAIMSGRYRFILPKCDGGKSQN